MKFYATIGVKFNGRCRDFNHVDNINEHSKEAIFDGNSGKVDIRRKVKLAIAGVIYWISTVLDSV